MSAQAQKGGKARKQHLREMLSGAGERLDETVTILDTEIAAEIDGLNAQIEQLTAERDDARQKLVTIRAILAVP